MAGEMEALIAALAWGADKYASSTAQRRHKRRSHRARGMYQQQAEQQFSKSAPLVSKAVSKAQSRVQGASRASGTYRPDVVAKQLGEMDINLGLALTRLKEDYTRQALGDYSAYRYGQAPAPSTDITQGVTGLMGIYNAAQKSPFDQWMEQQVMERAKKPEKTAFRPEQYMSPTYA
jgi:hypothetical protein